MSEELSNINSSKEISNTHSSEEVDTLNNSKEINNSHRSEEVRNLNSPENFTKLSGLIQQLDEKGWNRIWKPLVGRKKSIVFVFDKINNRLLYSLTSQESLSIKSRIIDPFLGVRYKAYAVSEQSKNFRFQTEFVFGDSKVPQTVLEIRCRAIESDDLAISYVEGGDPVKELCNLIKSELDVAFKDVYFRDIDSIQNFTEQMKKTVESLDVKHPYIDLEKTTIQINLPKSIEEAFDSIQKERIRHKTLVETKDHELVATEKTHLVEKMKRQAELELDELELSRLGITDPRIRLLMRDPKKRMEYLDQIYQQQMDLIKQSTEQDKDMLHIRLDTIEKFRDKALSEFSGVEELEQLLSLISQTTGIPSSQSILSSVTTSDSRAFPQLEEKYENEDNETDSKNDDVVSLDENEKAVEKDLPPEKRQRRRRTSHKSSSE